MPPSEARESAQNGQNWTHGRAGAPVGTREWADSVRLGLVAQVRSLGVDDESFVGYLELLQEHRAWPLLTKSDGTTFRTREEFCAYRRPWGLGVTWADLRPYVVSGLAKRGLGEAEIDRRLALDGVPVAMPVAESLAAATAAATAVRVGEKPAESPTGIHCRSEGPPRTTGQLRAITRAPEAVQAAYREGRISQTLAAKLGPKDPDGETAARIAEVAREIRTVPERKAVDALVRERLGVKPDPVGQLLRAFARLSRDDRDRFLQLASISLEAAS